MDKLTHLAGPKAFSNRKDPISDCAYAKSDYRNYLRFKHVKSRVLIGRTCPVRISLEAAPRICSVCQCKFGKQTTRSAAARDEAPGAAADRTLEVTFPCLSREMIDVLLSHHRKPQDAISQISFSLHHHGGRRTPAPGPTLGSAPARACFRSHAWARCTRKYEGRKSCAYPWKSIDVFIPRRLGHFTTPLNCCESEKKVLISIVLILTPWGASCRRVSSISHRFALACEEASEVCVGTHRPTFFGRCPASRLAEWPTCWSHSARKEC